MIHPLTPCFLFLAFGDPLKNQCCVSPLALAIQQRRPLLGDQAQEVNMAVCPQVLEGSSTWERVGSVLEGISHEIGSAGSPDHLCQQDME